jgi:hypothetical protein
MVTQTQSSAAPVKGTAEPSRFRRCLEIVAGALSVIWRYCYMGWWRFKHTVLAPKVTLVATNLSEWVIALTLTAKASLDAASSTWPGAPYLIYATFVAVAVLGLSKLMGLVFRKGRTLHDDVEQVWDLQHKLDIFRDEARLADSTSALRRLTVKYVVDCLRGTCNAFGRPGKTRASVMLEETDQDGNHYLEVKRIYPEPPKDQSDMKFRVKVQPGQPLDREIGKDEQIGAAGYAYWGLDTVYVPRISARTGYWAMHQEDGEVKMCRIHRPAWVKSRASRKYSCLASVPVYITRSDDEFTPWGILNVESNRADPMCGSEFYTACIIANLLAQGYCTARANFERLTADS